MIIDNTLVLSDHQAVTATAVSTNIWNLQAQGTPFGWISAYGRDAGEGFADIPLLIEVTEAFNNLTSLQLSVETDDNAAFSSATIIYTGAAIPLASLVAGFKFALQDVPKGVLEQYVRLRYTVVGTAPSTGKVFAAVTAGNQSNVH